MLAVGVLASLALSATARRAQQARLQSDLDHSAEAARRVVLARFDLPLAALRGQMELWSRQGPLSDAIWIEEAQRFLDDHDGFQALVRFDRKGRRTVAAKADGQRMLLALGSVGEPQGESAIGPIRVDSGATAMGLQVEYADPKSGGGVLAIVDPAELIAPALSDLARDAAIELSAAGVSVLEIGDPAAGEPERELELRPEIGPTWTLRVRPSVEAVGRAASSLPGYALVSGIVVSILLAGLLLVAQVASAQARALRDAHTTLQGRLDEHARAKAEVQKLNQTLEARVEARTAELNDAVLELETFVYSVSHDLRSPLGAIVNFAAILREDYDDRLDAAGRDHLARISRSAHSAVETMNALLAFSRTGRQEMHKGWVDVEELVQSVVAELALSGTEPKPILVVDRLPPAFADPSMLRLVFQNLLSNALKFSRDRAQPRVEITGRADARECEYAVIDDGVGFDMRHASKLFRVFERLHSAEEFPGNGVGLAIVARVVRRHGGRISAEGAPGKGATFRFALPRI